MTYLYNRKKYSSFFQDDESFKTVKTKTEAKNILIFDLLG